MAGFIDDGTFAEVYFTKNPLQKITVISVSAGAKHTSGAFVQSVITTAVKNAQRTSQNYCVIIQVLDADGYTEGVRWSTGTIERGATASVSSSLVLQGSDHWIQVFVWDGIGKSPIPLSTTFTQRLH